MTLQIFDNSQPCDHIDRTITFHDVNAQQSTRLAVERRPPAEVPKSPSIKTTIRGYKILKKLGEGGMGIVYLAREPKLQRLVALKILRDNGADDTSHHVRLRREARVVARLRHPNIVQIFSVGKHEGRSFLTLEYVDGETLDGYLENHVVSPTGAAELMETLARAVDHAHQQGIIHRDLKPANILLDKCPRIPGRQPDSALQLQCPKITDFGVAKDISRTGPNATNTGVLIGTLSYMAPEQAQSQSTVPATDVYALGVILYEMLTGRVPFRGAGMIETLWMINRIDPAPPRQLQSNCPRDLETICLKCLEKDAEKRYATAAELADDLRRFLERRPIKARHVSIVGRGWRWARRNPVVASLLAVIFLVMAVGATTATFFAVQADRRAGEAEQYAGAARTQKLVADQAKSREANAHQRTSWALYGCKICWAQRELASGNLPKAHMVLDGCPVDFRHWEFAYLRRLSAASTLALQEHQQPVSQIAFGPDSGWFVSAGDDRTIRLWNGSSGKAEYTLKTAKKILAMNTDAKGQWLSCALAGGGVKIWHFADVLSSKQAPIQTIATQNFVRATISPSADLLAYTTNDGHVAIQSIVLGAPGAGTILATWNHPSQVLTFSHDNLLLASAGTDGTIKIWEVVTGKLHSSLSIGKEIPLCLRFSPNQRFLAAGGRDKVIRLWDVKTGKLLHALKGHSGSIQQICFAPDSERLATASADKTVKIWNLSHGQDLLTLMEPDDEVRTVAFGPEGKNLAAGYGNTVRLWRVNDVR